MGDPRKLKNRYSSPRKVWDADRIKTEGALSTVYGLKNTREIWMVLDKLKKARRGAMKYLSLGADGQEQAQPLMKKLARQGIISPDSKIDDILSLSVENFLDRRLQSRVMKKGLARTAKQARQLITHGFISVNGKKVTIPSYLVTVEEENLIAYYKPIDISVHEEDKSKKLSAPKEGEPAGEKASEAPAAE
ncbi:MAG: 30S ribosomal protein S4 [Candidatus Micrarchaeota archaeon]|nr:30S ribosomal protein S4 [Candidatus Micrarchaeota archaeon]